MLRLTIVEGKDPEATITNENYIDTISHVTGTSIFKFDSTLYCVLGGWGEKKILKPC